MSSPYFTELYERATEAGDSMRPLWNDRMPFDMVDKTVRDLLDMTGRKVVITGGGGKGLGQACAHRFAGLGADVALVDLQVEDSSATGSLPQYAGPDPHGVAKEVAEKWGTKAVGIHGDATDWDDINRWMAECNEALGGIDVLINSAVDVAVVDFKTCTREEMDRSVRGTMVGPMYCTRVALDYMRPRGRGNIINIGSGAANTYTAPKMVLYGTGKASLAAFGKFVAAEVIGEGINVHTVHPASMVRTESRVPAGMNDMWFYSRIRNVLGRYLIHEELANVVAFLASDASTAIVGEVINADAGSSL